MATHKTQQLDINLSRIQDEAVREALSSILRFVNETSQRVRTNKDVKAGDVSNQGRSAGFDKQGWLWANRFRCNDVANKDETAGFDQQGNLWAENLEVTDLTATNIDATTIDCNDVGNVGGTVGWDSSGNFFAETLTIDSGGTFKVKVVTGSITAGNTATVYSGATVYGVCGYFGTGSAWTSIGDINDTGTIVVFDAATAVTAVKIINNGAVTYTYRVVIFHA